MANQTTKAWSKDVLALQEPYIENLVASTGHLIEAKASTCRVDPRYLQIQARLHVPFDPISNPPNPLVMQDILQRLAPRLPDMETLTIEHRQTCGIDRFPEDSYVSGASNPMILSRQYPEFRIPLKFGEVDPAWGYNVQKDLHYIHGPRDDSIGHFGFYVPDCAYPFCYAALSVCDRKYQMDALNTILPDTQMHQVLNMTRAYSFPPLPKNTMSKLFQMIANHYSSLRKYAAIITALNPLLGFKGSTFLGSSFVPFATSPMQYWYTSKGLYLNRRASIEGRVLQRMSTPPILWMARGLTRGVQRRLDANHKLHIVTAEQYENG